MKKYNQYLELQEQINILLKEFNRKLSEIENLFPESVQRFTLPPRPRYLCIYDVASVLKEDMSKYLKIIENAKEMDRLLKLIKEDVDD